MGKQIWKPGNMVYPLPAVWSALRTQKEMIISLQLHGPGQYARIRQCYIYP